jgi:hypothetical protein
VAETWMLVVLGVAVVLALLALVPVRIDVALVADALARRWRLRLRVGTAWGAPSWRLRLGSRRPPRASTDTAKPHAGPAPRRRRRSGPPPERIRALVGKVWQTATVRRARVSIELGNPDAAVTAVGCGAAWAVGGSLLAALPGLGPGEAALRVRPCYGGPSRLACRASVEARLRLWQAVAVALAVFL